MDLEGRRQKKGKKQEKENKEKEEEWLIYKVEEIW